MTTVEIQGTCHCGRIRLRLDWPDQALLAARCCGCSYCSRRNAAWISHPQACIDITVSEPRSALYYRFGTKTADFVSCRSCGTLCVAVSQIDGIDYAVVNLNCLTVPAGIAVSSSSSDFAGEEKTARLERRKMRWIGQVRGYSPD